MGLCFLAIYSAAWADEEINLTSESLEYRQEEDSYFAEGDAILTRGPIQLRARSLWFHGQAKQLKGVGGIVFTENGNTLFAKEIEYDFLTDKGVLLDGRLFLESANYTLTGRKIERLGLGKITLHEAFFTACDCPEDPDWHIKAASIRLTLGTYLTAKDVFFYADKTPIIYLPYFIYPVKTTRQTGFLIPHIGGSSTQGLRYNQDFFWAFSQNQDATFSLDYRDKKGVGSGIEYRYALSTETSGALQVERFHDIEKSSSGTATANPVAIRYRHQQRFSDRIGFNLSARYVSAEDYYTELSDFTSERALQKLESNAALTYRGDESFGYLLARYTQDLTRTDNRATLLQRLPEAGWSLIGHKIGPVFLDLHTTYTRFDRKTDFDWERIDLSPAVSLPLRVVSGIGATPWVKFHGITYSRTLLSNRLLRRNITGIGIDVDSESTGTIWKSPVHFSKKLTYEEINADDQSNIPQADEIDQVHNRRSMTLSLNPRSVSTSIRFTETYNIDLTPSSSDRLSDVRTEWSITPSPFFSFNTDLFYHWQSQHVTAVNTDLRVGNREKLTLLVGQRYTQGGLLPQKGDLLNPIYLGDHQTAPRVAFITGHLRAKLSDRLTFATEAFYDTDTDRFAEIHYGLLYERQCWLVAMAYQDLLNRNEFLFTVSLKGLGETLPRQFAYLFEP